MDPEATGAGVENGVRECAGVLGRWRSANAKRKSRKSQGASFGCLSGMGLDKVSCQSQYVLDVLTDSEIVQRR